jgi:hypothetical protein
MSARDDWVANLVMGRVVKEMTATTEKDVRITEVKRGRIWYENVIGASDTRSVDGKTGYSHDLSRRLIPAESWDPSTDDDDFQFGHWGMATPITDKIC